MKLIAKRIADYSKAKVNTNDKKALNAQIFITQPKLRIGFYNAHSLITEHLASQGRASEWISVFKDLLTCDAKNITNLVSYSGLLRYSQAHSSLINGMTTSALPPEYYLPLLTLSLDHPALLSNIKFHRVKIDETEAVDYMKALGLITNAKDIPFLQLNDKQRKAWMPFEPIRNIDAIILEIYKVFTYGSQKLILAELAKIKDSKLKLSILVFECFLNRSSPAVVSILEKNVSTIERFSNKQKLAFIKILDLEATARSNALNGTRAGAALGITNEKIQALIKKEAEAFLKLEAYDKLDAYKQVARNSSLMESLVDQDPKLAVKVFLHTFRVFKDNPYYMGKAVKADSSSGSKTPAYYVASVFKYFNVKDWKSYFAFSAELLSHPYHQDYRAYRYVTSLGVTIPFFKNAITTKTTKEFVSYLSTFDGTEKQDIIDMLLILQFRIYYKKHDQIAKMLNGIDEDILKKNRRVIVLMKTLCAIGDKTIVRRAISSPVYPRTKQGLTLAYDHRYDPELLADIFKTHEHKDYHLDFLESLVSDAGSLYLQLPSAIYSSFEALENPLDILKHEELGSLLNTQLEQSAKYKGLPALDGSRNLARKMLLAYPKTKMQAAKLSYSKQSLHHYINLSLSDAAPARLTEYLKQIITNPHLAEYPIVKLLCLKHGVITKQKLEVFDLKKIEIKSYPYVLYYDKLLEEAFSSYSASLDSEKKKYKLLAFSAKLQDSARDLSLLKENQDQRTLRVAKLIAQKVYLATDPEVKLDLDNIWDSWDLNVSKELKPYLDKRFNKNVLVVFVNKRMAFEFQSPAKHYFALQFDQLKLEELETIIDSITSRGLVLKGKGKDEFKKVIITGASMAALDFIDKKDYVKLEKLLPILRKLAELNIRSWNSDKSDDYINHYLRYLGLESLVKIAHLLCGKDVEYNLFRDSFNGEKAKKRFENSIQSNMYNYYTLRKPYLEAVLEHNPALTLPRLDSNNYIGEILKQGSISPKELAEMVAKQPAKPENLYKQQIHLARIHEVAGDKESAIVAWDKALELVSLHVEDSDRIYETQLANITAKYYLQDIDSVIEASSNLKAPSPLNGKKSANYQERVQALRKQLLFLKGNPVDE